MSQEMPSKPGLYWVKANQKWVLVDWQGHYSPLLRGYANMQGWSRSDLPEDSAMYMTMVSPLVVSEWGEKVEEPA